MNMPVFPESWPGTRSQALAALVSLLGPPFEGVFSTSFCPRRSYMSEPATRAGKRERKTPLSKLMLPQERRSLESLCNLGLDCLWWYAADRPEIAYCLQNLLAVKAYEDEPAASDFVWVGLEEEEELPERLEVAGPVEAAVPDSQDWEAAEVAEAAEQDTQ